MSVVVFVTLFVVSVAVSLVPSVVGSVVAFVFVLILMSVAAPIIMLLCLSYSSVLSVFVINVMPFVFSCPSSRFAAIDMNTRENKRDDGPDGGRDRRHNRDNELYEHDDDGHNSRNETKHGAVREQSQRMMAKIIIFLVIAEQLSDGN